MRISDWSSDVCSSDLFAAAVFDKADMLHAPVVPMPVPTIAESDVSANPGFMDRSEERRVGKECVSTCRSRWSAYHEKQTNKDSVQTKRCETSNRLNHAKQDT